MNFRSRRARGFTLIELMAAITILILIVLIAGSVTVSVLSGSNSVQRRAETDTTARAFMGRITYDLQTVVANNNAPLLYTLASATTSPGIAFVCASRSANTASTTIIPHYSAVYYQIGYPPNESQLSFLRGNEPIFWNSTDVPTYPSSTSGALVSVANAVLAAPLPANSNAPTNIDVVPMGSGIVRITYAFTLNNNNNVVSGVSYNGQTVCLPTGPSASPTYPTAFPQLASFVANNPTMPSGVFALDLTKIRAITIGIAVLDSGSLRALTAAQLQTLAGNTVLVEPPTGHKPLDQWSITNTGISALPAPVRDNLRFYQQTVMLQ